MANEPKKFDIAILGGGPGGYPAAIKAAQNGKKVALIEAKEMGGTCLNRGCIPTKTLIANAEVWEKINHAEEFGIHVEKATFDFAKMTKRKDSVVTGIRKSLEGLIASNGITVIRGFGKLVSPTEIKITGDNSEIITAEKIIIATGSEPRNMEAFPFDYERIHDSTSILNLTKLPKKLIIVGGGVIGAEFASLYAAFGVEVTILELMPTIIPTEDPSVSSVLTKAFLKKGIKIHTKVTVQKIEHSKDGVQVKLADGTAFDADIALVAVGRMANTSNIGLEKAGVFVNEKGTIPVNEKMETNIPGIYAIGDITGKWWLAHVATHQGIVAASNAAGIHSHINYNAVPAIIFTVPEIGTVGLTLSQATAKGYQAKLGSFPFQALGKSQATLQTDGFAQIVIDSLTNQILGAQVVGYEAATLVAEMGLAITNELTIESVHETIHAHPTIAEAWLEAAYIAGDEPIHWPPSKKKK